jgi:hypothetical protein
MLDSLIIACDEFTQQKLFDIYDPEYLFDLDGIISLQFSKQYPQFRGQILYTMGLRKSYPDKRFIHPDMKVPDDSFEHTFLFIENKFVVDLRHKILSPKGPLYRIISLTELKQEWLIISTTDALASFRSIKVFLERADIYWQRKKYPRKSIQDMCLSIKKEFEDAFSKYTEILKYVTENKFIFNGNEDENIHLKTMNLIYKPLFEMI